MTPTPPIRTRAGTWASLASLVLGPVVWALPFALFFGTLSGGTWSDYRGAYIASLVFATVIRSAITLAERVLLPRLRGRDERPPYRWLPEAAVYFASSVLASYLAAFIVNRFILRGFMGSPRAWVVSGMFAITFSLLVGGIIYARVFYRQAVARAVALERMRAELARAELRALRAQVNPHFLFNTLNTIAALIGENPAAAEDVVTRLADVFRHSLTSSSREYTRLGDELEFMRSWLAIERARFGERLRVTEDVEPGLDDVPVPGLLFQPLLENAIRYAVAPHAEGGHVTLRVFRDPGGATLTAEIADDGPGIAAGVRPSGTGVGLESVRERLRLLGPGHAFALETAPGAGTCVRVTLPLAPGPAASPATPHDAAGAIDQAGTRVAPA